MRVLSRAPVAPRRARREVAARAPRGTWTPERGIAAALCFGSLAWVLIFVAIALV